MKKLHPVVREKLWHLVGVLLMEAYFVAWFVFFVWIAATDGNLTPLANKVLAVGSFSLLVTFCSEGLVNALVEFAKAVKEYSDPSTS